MSDKQKYVMMGESILNLLDNPIMFITKKSDSRFSLDVVIRSFKILLFNGTTLKVCQDLTIPNDASEKNEIDILHETLKRLIVDGFIVVKTFEYPKVYVELKPMKG